MGYIRHDAIIATSWKDDHLCAAHTKAKDIGLVVSEVTLPQMNGERSFLIPPDGSKEGWVDSDVGDERRTEWIRWIKEQAEQGEMWVDWVHVRFCGDDDSAVIIDFEGNLESDNASRASSPNPS